MCVQISIVIPTYNHEHYIKKAINSVLMQKINFEVEVLIGEDCSSDKTRDILKSMEKTLPEHFQIFYREKNLYAGNFEDLYSRMRGKYFIILEGDDFWTYEYKLQKEYDFLESHPDYVAVAHNVQIVNEQGYPIKWNYPECKKEEYTLKNFQKGLFPGQTASVLMRNYYRHKLFDYDIHAPRNYPGDAVKAFLMAVNGRVYCFQEKWSAYRLVISHGSSFSANYRYSYQSKLEYYLSLYEYAKRLNKSAALKVTEKMYFWYLFGCLVKNKCDVSFLRFKKEFLSARFRGEILIYIIKKLFLMPFCKISEKIKMKRKNYAIRKSFQGMD